MDAGLSETAGAALGERQLTDGLGYKHRRMMARPASRRFWAAHFVACTCLIVSANFVSGVAREQQEVPNQRVEGKVPQNWRPGAGTIITGDAADKAEAAALTKYPGGTVNRVLKLEDGSYAVHMIQIRWPHHVFVSMDFEVTGANG
jgi:hypothetical protein